MLGSRVKDGRKQERNPRREAAFHDLRRGLNVHTSASSTSALPHWLDTDDCHAWPRADHRPRTIADAVEMKVPGDLRQSRRCQTPATVAAQWRSHCAHGLCEADELGRPFAFHAETDEQAGDLRGSGLPFMTTAIAAAASAVVRSSLRRSFSSRLEMVTSRKLRRIRRPSLVSTDSEWNCTP
jgi:hypothetical protein